MAGSSVVRIHPIAYADAGVDGGVTISVNSAVGMTCPPNNAASQFAKSWTFDHSAPAAKDTEESGMAKPGQSCRLWL
jgi:hypothetical protein